MMKNFVRMPNQRKEIIYGGSFFFDCVFTFERGGFFGMIIGDDDEIGRRPKLKLPPPAVSFSI
jgi:hypothetical protein